MNTHVLLWVQGKMKMVGRATTMYSDTQQKKMGPAVLWAQGIVFVYIVLVLVLYQSVRFTHHQEQDARQHALLESVDRDIQGVFARIEAALLLVPDLYPLGQVLTTDDALMRRETVSLFSKMIQVTAGPYSPDIDQISLLDRNGKERVRVQRTQGPAPYVCPEHELKDQSHAYYFTSALGLGRDQLYMSPMALALEDGRIREPHTPLIRFACPVFSPDGSTLGVMVLHYLAGHLQDLLNRVDIQTEGRLFLLNREGNYLYSSDPKKNFGFMFPGENIRFSFDYPGIWSQISATRIPRFTHASKGIFYRRDILPFSRDTLLKTSKLRQWTLLIQLPRQNIQVQELFANSGLFAAGAIFVPLLVGLGWILGKNRAGEKKRSSKGQGKEV